MGKYVKTVRALNGISWYQFHVVFSPLPPVTHFLPHRYYGNADHPPTAGPSRDYSTLRCPPMHRYRVRRWTHYDFALEYDAIRRMPRQRVTTTAIRSGTRLLSNNGVQYVAVELASVWTDHTSTWPRCIWSSREVHGRDGT